MLTGFVEGVIPFPLRMKICVPSRLKIAAVGYQPVGMKPLTNAWMGLLMSMSAIALLSPFATRSVLPSGEIDRESGVAVGGAFGKRLVEICSIGSLVIVLKDHTDDAPAHATNRRLPSGESTIAFGRSPVVSSLVSASVFAL